MKKIVASILAFLARKIISKHNPKIIGVSGSFGKTSTKEAIFYTLQPINKKIRRSRGSFNNELGFPLSIIGDYYFPGGAFFYIKAVLKGIYVWLFQKQYPDILILEYGADNPGDIKYLTDIVSPDIAVVTGFSDIPVHVEFYSSPEELAKEDFSLVDKLKENGTAILNIDDEMIVKMANQKNKNILFYGFSEKANFQISQFVNKTEDNRPSGVSFKVKTLNEEFSVGINGVLGRGIAYSGTAALACASVFGEKINNSVDSLFLFCPIPGRSRIIEGINDSWIIDDTYNSSPAALYEALAALKSIVAKRKIAVIGEMMELGAYSDIAHNLAGEKAAESADIIIGVGEKGKQIISVAEKLNKKTMWFNDSSLAAKKIKEIIEKGDLILIKGSQSVRTERVVKAIMRYPEKAKELLVRQYGNWLKK